LSTLFLLSHFSNNSFFFPFFFKPILIHPLARIYQPSPLGQGEEDKDKNPSPTNIQSIIHKTPIASYFVNRIEQYSSDDITSRSLDVGLYIINPLGVLSLFILSPQVQVTTNKSKIFFFFFWLIEKKTIK